MPRDDPALYATNTVEPINQPSDVIAIQRAEEKRQPIWGPSYYKLAMHIFIDESGTFIPNPLTPHKSGVMGAVVIPDSCLTEVFEAVDRLKTSSHWPTTDDGEIKGSLLNEKQIADLIAILRGRNITFTACCCDLSHYEADDLTQFQLAQSDALVRRVGLEHQSSLVRELLQVRNQMLDLPLQLFIQLHFAVQTIISAFQFATLYLAEMDPRELGSFTWRVDAKAQLPTRFETLWSQLLPLIFQGNFDFLQIEDLNYSHFERFYLDSSSVPDYLRERITPDATGGFKGLDGKAIYRDLQFMDSRSSLGLQIADVLTTALRRALDGKLKKKGWRHLGALMFEAPRFLLLSLEQTQERQIIDRHVEIWRGIGAQLIKDGELGRWVAAFQKEVRRRSRL